MKRLPLFLLVLVLAACGGGADGDDGSVWGGYTESEAKDVLADPNVKAQIVENAPDEAIRQLYPTQDELEEADLRKVTYEGQESWQWRHAEEDFCILVYEDQELESFTAFVSRCVAD